MRIYTQPNKQFTYFTFLWCITAYIHQLAYPYKLTPWWGTIYVFATICSLLKPNSLFWFTLFITVSCIKTFIQMPFVPNHFVFEFLLNITILLIIVFSFLSRRTSLPLQEIIYERFSKLLRLQTIFLYYFTALAKFNTDYLNPDYSCASGILKSFLMEYFYITPPAWPLHFSIWISLFLEIAIPTFLFFNKTRNLGIVLGIFFHFFIGLHPVKGVLSFSAVMFSLFFIFLSREAFSKFTNYIGHFQSFYNRKIHFLSLKGIIVVLLYGFLLINNFYFHEYKYVFYLWNLFAIILLTLYLSSISQGRKNILIEKRYFLPQPPFLILLLLPFLINGLAPYFGIKTQGCFTMFSNLRLLGSHPNHLFIPPPFRMGNNDLIKILKADHPRFNIKIFDLRNTWTSSSTPFSPTYSYLLTYFEFHRITSEIPKNFSVTYQHNGEVKNLTKTQGSQSNDELLRSIPWLQKKLIIFKPVLEGDHGYCTW